MRVLFVYPDLAPDVTDYTGVVSYGIAALSAVLKQAGHEVRLFHMTSESSEGEFRERIGATGADLVAFSTNSHYARRLLKWAAWTRSEADIPVAVGGVHATVAPEKVYSSPDVAFTCIGEGESALVELCRALEEGHDPSSIENFCVRNGTTIHKNPVRSRCQNLDELPNPDLSVFDFSRLYTVRYGMFPYIMSRGCAFDCSYCSAPALRRLSPGQGPFWRFLSPKRAANQLRELLARYMPEARLVHFLDAIVFPERDWLAEFAPLYKEYVGKPFSCNLRPDFVSAEIAEILRNMGCAVVRMGVESGDDEMTKNVLMRRLTIEDVRRAFAILDEYGIERWSYNMVGLPGETLGRALKTVRLNAEMKPDLVLSFIFHPYPGTPLRELCARSGYLTDKECDHYTIGVTTQLPAFRPSDILFVQRFFVPLVKLYRFGQGWPKQLKHAWGGTLDFILAGPLLPRKLVVYVWEGYKHLRHRMGEHLVRRSPRLYRMLGGTAPAWQRLDGGTA